MGRANNERPSCSSKAQKIVRSVIGIQQKSFNILILLTNPLLNRVLMLDTVLPTLGYLSSYLHCGVRVPIRIALRNYVGRQ